MIVAPVKNSDLSSCDKDILNFGHPKNLINGVLLREENGKETTIYSLEELELNVKYNAVSFGVYIERLNETQINVNKEFSPLGIPNNVKQSRPININQSPTRSVFHESSSPFFVMSPNKSFSFVNPSNRSSSSGSSPFSTNPSPRSRVGSLSDEFFEHVSFRPNVSHDLSLSSSMISELKVEIQIPLKAGERLEKIVEDVIYFEQSKENKVGTLYMTNFQLIFTPLENENPPHSDQFFQMDQEDISNGDGNNCYSNNFFIRDSSIMIPYATISRFEKIDRTSGHFMFQNSAHSVDIYTKDFRRSTRFGFDQTKHSRNEICNLITKHIYPCDVFDVCRKQLNNGGQRAAGIDGWNLYNCTTEYERLGIKFESDPNCKWRYTTINGDYKFCPTYPKLLVVPAQITDEELQISSNFRSKGRIPILSWIDIETGASISRSSQPKIGIKMNRCREDEKVLKAIRDLNPNTEKLYVLDARPSTNALANVAIGGGSENHGAYCDFCNVEFLNIPNIHNVRDSWNRLRELCEIHCVQGNGSDIKNSNACWLSQLESTHWLDNVSTILSGALRVVHLITSKKSVLLHCTDGWDRTPQVSSLAQLLLDKYYRTTKGFCILIEKEWISVGHKFGERLGLNGEDGPYKENQKAPILSQFLDCVWQVLNQFPHAFEFTEDLLLTISEHLYSGEFGTFLMNCEKERVDKKLAVKTTSLWTFILSDASKYNNPFYFPNRGPKVLKPASDIKNLLFWKSNYMRYLRDSSSNMFDFQKIYVDLGRDMQAQIVALQNQLKQLQEENENLKKNHNQPNNIVTPVQNGVDIHQTEEVQTPIARATNLQTWEDYNGPSEVTKA